MQLTEGQSYCVEGLLVERQNNWYRIARRLLQEQFGYINVLI